MKNTNKKGFTIVELVVVIAVIAILAAVLIPTFSNVIKSARQSADSQLVRNLNTAVSTELAASGKTKASTAYEALGYAKANGYDIAIIVAKSDNNIAWSRDTGAFVLIDTAAGTATYPTTNGTENLIVEGNEVNYFLICSAMPESGSQAAKYSIYAGKDWDVADVTLNAVGFDAGDSTVVKTVNYTNNASGATAKDVVIRTNSAATTLTINDDTDGKIYHYDTLGILNVTKCGYSCYYEYGTTAYAEATIGKIVAKEGGAISVLYATAATVAAQEDGGTIGSAYCAGTASEYDTFSDGKAGNIDFTYESNIDAKKDEVAGEAINAAVVAENNSYVARIGTQGYTSFAEAVGVANAGDTLYVLKDCEINGCIEIKNKNSLTIDLGGNTLTLFMNTKFDYVTLDIYSDTTIQNGTIKALDLVIDNDTYNPIVMWANEDANITLAENLTIDGGQVGVKLYKDFTGIVTINGTIKNCNSGVYNDGATGTVNINGSISSKQSIDTESYCIYNDGGTVNIINGDFTSDSFNSNSNLIYNKNGTVTISNGTFTSNDWDPIYNKNGTVTIEAGTFYGENFVEMTKQGWEEFVDTTKCDITFVGTNTVVISKK